MVTQCKMCGNSIEVRDRRRRFCDGCREARKHMFDKAAVQALRDRARQKRKQEQEELEGLRVENEMLREEVIRLKSILGEPYDF